MVLLAETIAPPPMAVALVSPPEATLAFAPRMVINVPDVLFVPEL
jgi:hypothetical protein